VPPVPGWLARTWPVLAIGVLSVAMWTGRIRNIVGDDDLTGAGRLGRLALAASFVVGGLVVLGAAAVGWRTRSWRHVARRDDDGWRVGPGVPEWGRRATVVLAGWTIVVWTVQGIGILLDPNHDVGFKVVHTVLMVGSLAVGAVALWGASRTWPVAPVAPSSRMVG